MNQNEQNNNMNQSPVIQPQQQVEQPINNQATIKPNQSGKPFVAKKQNKKVMIIAVVAIVAIGIFFIIFNTKTGQKILGLGNNAANNEYEIIKIETSQKWGDKYAEALQNSFYKNIEVEINGEIREKYQPTEFAITFIDFLFDSTPEMVVKYTDSLEKETIRVFTINNEEVSETKDFKNADFKMVYSIREKTLKWYIYITSATSKKYGSYTMMDKILNSTALGVDIPATTDIEITTFNVNYVTADFRTTYYTVEKSKLEEDFRAAVLRYETTNSDAQTAKKTIEDNYGSVNIEEDIDQKESVIVGKYSLKYGTYVSIVEVFENGVSTGTREDLITINRNGTVKIGDDIYKFNVYSNLFMLSNNKSFTILDNNKFQYGTGTGQEYNFKE